MKYVAAALIAPFALAELALRLVIVLPLAATILGLVLLGEYPELANALVRPILLPSVAKVLSA